MNKVFFGDCRDSLRQMAADGVKVQMCVTSPPYFGLRDYNGGAAEIGQEETPERFIAALVDVFAAVRDVLSDDGVLWINIGDSYSTGTTAPRQQGKRGLGAATQAAQDAVPRIGNPEGCKTKDLIGIPWMLAFALRADGWYLRQDIIWHKPNPMPESVTDRCTKSHEYMFLLSKSPRYFYDHAAIKEPAICGHAPGNHSHKGATAYAEESGEHHRTKSGLVAYAQKVRESKKRGEFDGKNTEPGKEAFGAVVDERNKRSVWTVATTPYSGAHFATFPPALIEPCILAGSMPGQIVLDPFFGSGTTGQVALALGRQYIGCELNSAYEVLQKQRTQQPAFVFTEAA